MPSTIPNRLLTIWQETNELPGASLSTTRSDRKDFYYVLRRIEHDWRG